MSEQNSEPSAPFDPPVPPTAPPAPPAAPERPDVPRYGEYAPAGSVPTYGTPVTPPNPYGVPTYGSAVPVAPAAPAVVAAPQYAAPAYAPVVRKRRTWDVVLTIILLVLGLFGTILSLLYASIFANPELLNEAMESQGFGGFTGSAGAAPAILVISHVALFLLVVGLSIPLLIRGRIVVFWIPLVAGIVAAVIFWSTLASVIVNDPGFVSRVGGFGG